MLINIEQEDDGRWIAEIVSLPGIMAYGDTPGDAVDNVIGLAKKTYNDVNPESIYSFVVS